MTFTNYSFGISITYGINVMMICNLHPHLLSGYFATIYDLFNQIRLQFSLLALANQPPGRERQLSENRGPKTSSPVRVIKEIRDYHFNTYDYLEPYAKAPTVQSHECC